MLNILVIAGSTRVGNYTQHVAKFVVEQLQKNPDLSVEFVSPATLGLKLEDEGTQAGPQYPQLGEQIKKADAFVIVSPEYNHGYPGSLKYLLDLHFAEYFHKPAGIVGVSDGAFGGARMIESLIHVFKTMKIVAIKPDVNVSNVDKEIIDGKFVEPEKWERRLNEMMKELLWLAEVLKNGRETN